MGGVSAPPYFFIMSDFDTPLNREPDGTYITIAQMHFFLNRKDGKRKFKNGHADFFEYYNLCRVYNLVSEMMKESPDCAIMYWDEKQGVVSMGFPTDGEVAKALAGIEHAGVLDDEDEDDDDEFGIFESTPWDNG